MDSAKDVGHIPDWFQGGVYWGAMGRDPAWDRYYASGEQGPAPEAGYHFMRYSGGGNYAGVLGTFVGLWTALGAFPHGEPVFTPDHPRIILFCGCPCVL